ncbi:hypothetical protein D3C81_1085320 [compost metagenome]
MLDQRIVDRLFAFGRIRRQVDKCLRAAIAVLALVGHDAAAHGVVGGILVGLVQRRVDVEAARIGFLAILCVHELAHDFRDIFGMGGELVALATHLQLLAHGLVVLLRRDVAEVAHALEDVLLAHLGAARVHHGVVGRRRLRQAGQHGGLRRRHVLDRLAEVDPRGAGEAVGALPQVDLVHVQLEDLVLGQVRLDLVRQQHLVDLARVGLLAREEEVARHLHGDGGGALRQPAAQVGQPGAQHAHEVHAAVLVEAVVLDREHGLLHDVRDLGDRHEVAALLAELADQHVVRRVDPQRDLRAVVGDGVQRRQVGRGHHQRIAHQQRHGDEPGDKQSDQPEHDPRPERTADGKGRLLLCCGHKGLPNQSARIISSGMGRPRCAVPQKALSRCYKM